MNVAALVINFVAAVSSGEVPLTAVQLLWVNLIMDTLGALALATERPSSDLMTKKPVGRSEPLITKNMWRNLISQALYQVVILLTLVHFKPKKKNQRPMKATVMSCWEKDPLCRFGSVFDEYFNDLGSTSFA